MNSVRLQLHFGRLPIAEPTRQSITIVYLSNWPSLLARRPSRGGWLNRQVFNRRPVDDKFLFERIKGRWSRSYVTICNACLAEKHGKYCNVIVADKSSLLYKLIPLFFYR